jgi:transcription elongation factor GreA-like protein
MPPSDLASFEDSTGGLMKLLRGKTGPQDDDAKAKAEVTKAMRCKLREAHRIDYVLQVSEFELSLTEYLSALQAHTCYFETPDVVKFILETLDDA